jgi:crotonobetainyl-CoA:carnitine CoA-transferase CaiB-like acyl-CoA transferase
VAVLGDETLMDDARLCSNQARVANRDYVDGLINGVFSQLN